MRLARLVVIIILLCSSTLLFSETREEKQHALFFDIPAQPLKDAIIAFGLQAHVSVFISPEDLAGLKSSPVIGRYGIEVALSLILSKTHLGFTFDAVQNSIKIVEKASSDEVVKQKESRVSENDPLEEVYVVSARHREEEIQNVPMSIATFNEKDLETTGRQNLVKLSHSIANTSFNVIRGTNSVMAAYIRGLGQKNPLAGIETSVGTYIDGVYFNRPLSVILDVYGAERIEVLRGPQGTLYGRNTIGGAVKYVSKKLPDEFETDVRLTYGTFNQADIVVSTGAPISERLKVGASFAKLTRDGFGKNHFTGEEHFDKDIAAYRVSAEYEPNEKLYLRLALDLAEDNSGAISGHRLFENAGEQNMEIFDTQAGMSTTGHPIDAHESKTRGESLTMRWHLNEKSTLDTIVAHREENGALPTDIDGTEAEVADLRPVFDNEQSSIELRYSISEENYHALLGLYVLDASAMNAIDYANSPTNFFIPGITRLTYFTFNQVNTDTQAIFGSFDYDLRSDLSASFGLRFTHEEREATIIRNQYLPTSRGELISPYFGGESAVPILPIPQFVDELGNEVWPTFKGKRKDESLTPRVSLSWFPQENRHVYMSYSSGFKSGGYAPKGQFTDSDLRKGFDPEKVFAYEIGIKNTFQDGAYVANINVFHNDYRDMQVEAPELVDLDADGIKDAPLIVTTNIDGAEISGVELDLKAAWSDSWQSDLSLGYLNARYTEYLDLNGANVADQRDFVDAPKIMASLLQTYKTDFLSGKISVIAGLSYRSDYTLFQAESRLVDQSSFYLFNTSINWLSQDDRWGVHLNALNLTDERYKTSGYFESPFTEDIGVGDIASVYYGEPRRVSVTLRFKY